MTPQGLSLTSAVVVSLTGGAIGLLIIYIDSPFPADATTFTDTDAYRLWVGLICLDMAVWALLLLPIGAALRSLARYWYGNTGTVITSLSVYSSLLIGFVVVTSLLLGLPNELPHLRAKVLAFGLVGALVSIAAAAAILLVHAALNCQGLGDDSPESIANFLRLRANFQRLMFVESTIFGLAFLSAGALRNAFLTLDYYSADNWPREALLLYGLYLSALLLALYVPTYTRLFAVGRALRDTHFPMMSPRSPQWVEWSDGRKRLEDLLRLETTATAGVRVAAAVLTPVAGALGALLLGLT
jgi:hypothetical protein